MRVLARCIPFLIAGVGSLQAQPSNPEAPSSSPKILQAERLASNTPVIDGIVDEPLWQSARPVTGFVQMRPVEGAPATEQTEVRMAYDDNALFVAARMNDTSPDSIAGELFRRDGNVFSDWFYVMVDSYADRRTAFVFAINPAGVKKDILVSNDTQEDLTWDAVWEGAAKRDDQISRCSSSSDNIFLIKLSYWFGR